MKPLFHYNAQVIFYNRPILVYLFFIVFCAFSGELQIESVHKTYISYFGEMNCKATQLMGILKIKTNYCCVYDLVHIIHLYIMHPYCIYEHMIQV